MRKSTGLQNEGQVITPPDHEKTGRNSETILTLAKAAGITGIAFLLSLFLSSPFAATLSALFSSNEKGDFVMSDLFFQIADNRPVRHYDDRIVILDIGNSNRQEIAETLSVLSLCGPRAVGIDINFEEPGEDDSFLLEALSSLPNLTLPLGVTREGDGFKITDRPFFYETMDGVNYGVINFPTAKPGATVREYARSFSTKEAGELPSFPEMIAKSGGFATDLSLKREEETGVIDYSSKEITTINHHELNDRAEEFADKIVLVGTTNEAGDVYSTPLSHNVSGLEIHAYALSTILDGTHIRKMPGYIDTIIAIVICYLMVLGAVGIKSAIRGLLLRIAQIATLYLLVRIGYSLFVDHYTIADFSQALLMVAFGLFSVDLWNGATAMGKYILGWVKRIRERFNRTAII